MSHLPLHTPGAPESVADIRARVKAAGYRFNEERESVARTLLDADGPITAEDAWLTARASLARVSRATVYRTLNIFTRLGITEPSLRPRGGQSFRLRRTLPSIYLVHAEAGVIDELEDPAIAEALEALTRRSGYRLRGAIELRVEPLSRLD